MTSSSQEPRAVLAWLREAIAAMLQLPLEQIDPAVRFWQLGLSSAQITLLTERLSVQYGCPIAPIAAWEHPTPRALSQRVARILSPHESAKPPSSEAARTKTGIVSAPIAIVGIGCRLPGSISSPADFWTLLCEGRSAIREVRKERWDSAEWVDEDPAAPGKMSTRWGGFLDEVDTVDAAFFGISPREARQMDPQQRLALELAWEALEDAGIDPTTLRGTRVGVFFGAMWSDYAKLIAGDARAIDSHTATGQDTSIISARISYTLGLEGTSLTVNSACSSSLLALHLACQSLRLGEISAALVGGVHLMISPESTVAMTKFGAMNPAGQCRAFDASANGYVRGEGGGVVVLKPLGRAIADGDRIYCLIRGSAANNDGFSNGLTAPNPLAQAAVLRAAYANAGVDPNAVSYVETHGPGTVLGDPIEAQALGAVLGRRRAADQPLRIGSVKTNIGHLEAAAGRGRADQGGACAASWRAAEKLALRSSESTNRLRGLATQGTDGARGLACRWESAACRSQRIRLWRHQLPRRPRGCTEKPRSAATTRRADLIFRTASGFRLSRPGLAVGRHGAIVDDAGVRLSRRNRSLRSHRAGALRLVDHRRTSG